MSHLQFMPNDPRPPLDVYITVDTEVWPQSAPTSAADLDNIYAEDVYGTTESGAFGVTFQMDVLNSYGLRAVFFVEALAATAFGSDHLARLVSTIQDRGHEVQLHVHPEWLKLGARSILPDGSGKHMKDFGVDDQARLIEVGLDNLRRAGAADICAFRAGNCGANLDTLRALHRNHVTFDSSYNLYYRHSYCELATQHIIVQPTMIEGVTEVPITFFEDWPGHYRHVQLCACSSAEIQSSLLDAHARGWRSFVILSHSFELLTGRQTQPRHVRPEPLVIRRFHELCQFLASHRDKFTSTVFSERRDYPRLDAPADSTQVLRSNVARTSLRYLEQLSRRFS